jgi:kumamolisin
MKQKKSVYLVGDAGPFKIVALLLVLLLAGCGSTNSPAPTPTPSIPFSRIDLGIPADALNSPVTGPVNDSTVMHVVLFFKVNQSQQQQLQKISGQGQSLEKQANSIGISDSAFQQVKNYLGIENVSLTLSKLHTSVAVDAKAKTIATLFQTHFVYHKYKGRTFYAPTTQPQLPSIIVANLVSVTGLDNYSKPLQPGFSQQLASNSQKKADCTVPLDGNLPQSIAHAYGYDEFARNGFQGQGMTINLIEIDGLPEADVASYGQCVDYHGKITVTNVDGAPAQPGGESALDVEMIQGLAPYANIVDYQTADPGKGVVDALQQVVDDNANDNGSGGIVSISLGGPENSDSLSDLKAEDQLLSLLTQQEHMTVFVASGDCAAFTDQIYGSLSVSFPASDPYAVAVGGTILQTDQQSNRAAEAVWSDGSDPTQCSNAWGSGGGNSTFFQQPSFQTGQGVKNDASRGFRQVPDISAVAYNLPVYFNGQWQPVGGTSAATPIWAAGMALVNQAMIKRYQVFFYGPTAIYYAANHAARSSPYYDVTQGSNLAFNATPGWDFASGFGTPNLVDFYNVLATASKQ